MNDFQRLPARLLPFFPHNFLPQQRAVNILASRINCLSHPRKTVNRHATSPIFTTNHGRFIKISIWLPSRVKAASGLGRLENYEIRRGRERELWERGNKNWTHLRELGLPLGKSLNTFYLFFCSRNILQGMKQHRCISAKILKNL